MSLHDEFLDLAERLLKAAPSTDDNADLRRAVSSAYYGLFHRLISEAVCLFTPDVAIRNKIARSFEHSEIKDAAAAVSQSQWPKSITSVPGLKIVAQDLVDVAKTFVDLQERRHVADYVRQPTPPLKKKDCEELVKRTRDAFEACDRLQRAGSLQWNTFLQCLLLHKRWNTNRG